MWVVLVICLAWCASAWLSVDRLADPMTITHLECAAACEYTGIKAWSTTACECNPVTPPKQGVTRPVNKTRE